MRLAQVVAPGGIQEGLAQLRMEVESASGQMEKLPTLHIHVCFCWSESEEATFK